MAQITHAIETGVLLPGDQLPGIRKVSEDLVINPNTVAKAYRELAHLGLIELRQGTGAFVTRKAAAGHRSEVLQQAQPIVQGLVERLLLLGLAEDEIRRLVEAELMQRRRQPESPASEQ